MECSPPGSSVHRIFQARVLEWVAISFSRGSSWPRDWIQVSRIASRCFTVWATRETLRYPYGKAFQNYSNKPILNRTLCCILLLPLKHQSRSGSGFPLTPVLCHLTKTWCFPLPLHGMRWPCSGTCEYNQLSFVLFSFPSVAASTLPYVPNIYILRTLQAWRGGTRGRNGEKGGRMSNSPQWVLKRQIIYF